MTAESKQANFSTALKDSKIGAIKGVFLPSFLQMIGVILFMRVGWILGHVGLLQMFFIMTMSSALLFITSLSMTSIVSNMKMGSGGSYYIISRLLGVGFGSAIGILLIISMHASVALCVSGFVLSVQNLFPALSTPVLKILTIFTLAFISYISTSLALKTQVVIFIALVISIISIFLGGSSNIPTSLQPLSIAPSLSFWMAFAMFFPATTGIDSGMAMSGDLKNPSKALPLGTLGAVLLAYFVYLSICLFLTANVSSDMLRSHPFIVFHLSKISFMVTLGVWGASLSSALGSILSAPRIMQSIAKDGSLPKFLSKGYGITNQPRIATLIVFFGALVLTLFTEIDQIIPIMTMINLVTYGLINFVAFFEEFIQNPSWRPTFRINWVASLVGALGCFMAMFMINPGATFLVAALTILLCLWTAKRHVRGNWDDLRYSLFSYLIHKGAVTLSALKKNPKSWRPHILTIFNSPAIQKNLVLFSHSLNQEKGFLTFGFCPIRESFKNLQTVKLNFQKNIEAYKIPSYVHINPTSHFLNGISELIKNYGFGPLKPNTIILPLSSQLYEKENFARLLSEIHSHGKNLILLKDDQEKDCISKNDQNQYQDNHSQINLWWRGQYRRNFELCLALAYILKKSKNFSASKICIKTVVKDEAEKTTISKFFERYKNKLRIKNINFIPIIEENEKFFPTLDSASEADAFTFLGLRKQREDESNKDYQIYFLNMFEKTKNIKNLAFIIAGEQIKFEKIFT